jgi:6-phosphogluconolactonase
MMNPEIKIYPTAREMAITLTEKLAEDVTKAKKSQQLFSIALSGGNTPRVFFEYLANTRDHRIAWEHVHLFWGDERCVSPEHSESNFGMTKTALLDKINIPAQNVHRIKGEADPLPEAERYGQELKNSLPITADGFPCFDWMILGLGMDGHTASLFPGSELLDNLTATCATAVHPQTGQKRITLTLPVINNSRRVLFLVSGQSKAVRVASILKHSPRSRLMPAARVHPLNGILEWHLDKTAAEMIQL